MSENESGSDDRTLEPTAKRLREARERGQVPRSRELAGALIAICAAATWLLGAGPLGSYFLEALRKAFRIVPSPHATDGGAVQRLADVAIALFLPALPVIGVCLLAAVFGSVALGGFNASAQAITPDLRRIDPGAGLARLFSLTALGEVGKSLLRVLIVGAVAWLALRGQLDAMLGMTQESSASGIAHALSMVGWTVIALAAALVLVAAIDVPFQAWTYRRQLRMTPEELRREMKETEGNPEVKGRIRRLRQEMAQRRMFEDVPQADVVLVNPTHYAVALKYDASRMRAPRVVAKGADLIAQRIRALAEQHKVAVVSSPPLARALFRASEVGDEIPVKAYQAVAQILSFVYQLKAYRRHGGKAPNLPKVEVDENEIAPPRP
jgi:flagellar biosynthetic protein FlhB